MNRFPIYKNRKKILFGIVNYEIILIIGATGSGKTIFIPNILHNSGMFSKIVVTQTRRLSAISASKFSSDLFNYSLGEIYGYSVRFDNKSNNKTPVKFVTDGILFQEIISDPLLKKYSCIIIDEFHERSLYTDIIIILLRKIMFLRKDLKVVFMSATGDNQKLVKFFDKKIGKIYLPGKIYKIDIMYLENSDVNYLISMSSIILWLHVNEEMPGDIICFLPGVEEINKIFTYLKKILARNSKKLFLFKLHGSITTKKQNIIYYFFPKKTRKIILSTNIAESSITIPGIKYVVDCGLSKQNFINWQTGLNYFRVFPVSKSEIIQRSGRSGREKNGKCYRLFTWGKFNKLNTYQNSQINRIKIESMILNLISIDMNNLFDLEFLDVPSKWLVRRSIETLYIIGALDDSLCLTTKGKFITLFPLDIKLAKCIIEAMRSNHVDTVKKVITCCAFLSVHVISKLPHINRTTLGDISNFNFFGDNIKYVQLVKNFQRRQTIIEAKTWCRNKKYDFASMAMVISLKNQLFNISNTIYFYFRNTNSISFFPKSFINRFNYCFSSGFFLNSIYEKYNRNYSIILSGINIHPENLDNRFTKKYKTMIFDEIVIWKKFFVYGLSPTKISWLIDQGFGVFR